MENNSFVALEKAKTLPLPRATRSESPSPSVTSAALSSSASTKTTASNKKGPLKNLRKVPLAIRKKKKKNDGERNVVVDQEENVVELARDNVNQSDDTVGGGGIADDTSSVKTASVTGTTLSSASPVDSKPPKSPRRQIKNIVKGGKGIVNMFKSKKEAQPIMVDAPLDLRRTTATLRTSEEREGDGDFNKENNNSVVDATDAEEEQNKAEWSVSSTCKKVKKLSRIEVQFESVYADAAAAAAKTNDDVESEIAYKEANGEILAASTAGIVATSNDTPINFNAKSPTSLKKEILEITRQRSFQNESNRKTILMDRQRSVEAKYTSDKNDLLFKILVIGELGTGKTSIIKRYVHQFFSQHYRATIGVDFALKVLSWDNGMTIRLQLWDIAGQERFGNMTRVYYKEAVGAFIVFDVTRGASFEAVTKWKQDLDSKVQLPDGETIPCVLLANKCDQPKEGLVNNCNKMDEFCRENQFTAWYETSAKENINVDEAAQCLVSKIVQNDQKRKLEKEATNGAGVVSINDELKDTGKNKFCNAC